MNITAIRPKTLLLVYVLLTWTTQLYAEETPGPVAPETNTELIVSDENGSSPPVETNKIAADAPKGMWGRTQYWAKNITWKDNLSNIAFSANIGQSRFLRMEADTQAYSFSLAYPFDERIGIQFSWLNMGQPTTQYVDTYGDDIQESASVTALAFEISTRFKLSFVQSYFPTNGRLLFAASLGMSSWNVTYRINDSSLGTSEDTDKNIGMTFSAGLYYQSLPNWEYQLKLQTLPITPSLFDVAGASENIMAATFGISYAGLGKLFR
ncbi:MAG: hypothetical protein OEZ43_15230 [Gammaproteobacteria bacterium]|nr:hypothetical protein [Gammaproteobacteria bacterium]